MTEVPASYEGNPTPRIEQSQSPNMHRPDPAVEAARVERIRQQKERFALLLDLACKAATCRARQKDYFATKNRPNLHAAIVAENALDLAIDAIVQAGGLITNKPDGKDGDN